jgi:hypothetical protein
MLIDALSGLPGSTETASGPEGYRPGLGVAEKQRIVGPVRIEPFLDQLLFLRLEGHRGAVGGIRRETMFRRLVLRPHGAPRRAMA